MAKRRASPKNGVLPPASPMLPPCFPAFPQSRLEWPKAVLPLKTARFPQLPLCFPTSPSFPRAFSLPPPWQPLLNPSRDTWCSWTCRQTFIRGPGDLATMLIFRTRHLRAQQVEFSFPNTSTFSSFPNTSTFSVGQLLQAFRKLALQVFKVVVSVVYMLRELNTCCTP